MPPLHERIADRVDELVRLLRDTKADNRARVAAELERIAGLA